MSEREWKARTGQRIEKLYAWIAEEPDGGEGIVAGMLGERLLTPLVGADRARIESYRGIAQDAAEAMGYPVRLKVFGAGVVIDEIKVKGDREAGR